MAAEDLRNMVDPQAVTQGTSAQRPRQMRCRMSRGVKEDSNSHAAGSVVESMTPGPVPRRFVSTATRQATLHHCVQIELQAKRKAARAAAQGRAPPSNRGAMMAQRRGHQAGAKPQQSCPLMWSRSRQQWPSGAR